MKISTVMRLYSLIAVALLAAWFINLYEALSRPIVDWGDAVALPLLVTISIVLIMLTRARAKRADEPAAHIRIGAGRYIAAGLLVAGLVAVFLLGFHAHS
ncbi:MAG TPA: hypothetical protein VHY19_00360 [Steroidobacteraceae bacterium]|jgi:hypothetical protein|nr:hypothetical protein [Steroidobacteraceae bacterium]